MPNPAKGGHMKHLLAALVLVILAPCTGAAPATPEPLSPEELKAVVREINAMLRTDEAGVVNFVVHDATPQRIERLLAMPEWGQLPRNMRENALIFAGKGHLLSFDKPSDVLNKVAAWFPEEVAFVRTSKDHFFFGHLDLQGPFANWDAEPAAFFGMWNCTPQLAWLKPQVNPFRHRPDEDGGLAYSAIRARSSDTREMDFGFCIRHRNGRLFAMTEKEEQARQQEIAQIADRVTPILQRKFAAFLAANGCQGTGPDDCVLVLHLWASLSPGDPELARAIQRLEKEVAPDSPLPELRGQVTHQPPATEEERARLDGALRRAAFLRAKLLSVLHGGTAWKPDALAATLRQMTALRQKMYAVMDWRLESYELEYRNDHLNPWWIVAENFATLPQLRNAVWAELDSYQDNVACASFEPWFKTGGPALQSEYVLKRWEQGQAARCASPDLEWLKKGETAEARALRQRYLALIGRGDLDEQLLGSFTGNGAACFGPEAAAQQDWQRELCRNWISEPQQVTRQLAHSKLALSAAEEFGMVYAQPPGAAQVQGSPAAVHKHKKAKKAAPGQDEATASPPQAEPDQGKWLLGLISGMTPEAARQMQALTDGWQRNNIWVSEARIWTHPQHDTALLELSVNMSDGMLSHALLQIGPQGVTQVAIPPRFANESRDSEILHVSDLDGDDQLELWWGSFACHHDETDLERDLDCAPKTLDMGEVHGHTLSYFTRSARKQTVGAPLAAAVQLAAAVHLAAPAQPERKRGGCSNTLLVGSVLADKLGINFGNRSDDEGDPGQVDVIDLVCKPHPLHPEQMLVALFHNLKEDQTQPEEGAERKGFVLAVVDFGKKKVIRLYRGTVQEDATTRIYGSGALQLDTARYNLAPGVRALGVRMNIGYSTRYMSGGENNFLTLFVEEGGKLRPVLERLPMSSWSTSDAGTAEEPEIANVEYTLAVLASTTNGWHDLEVTANYGPPGAPGTRQAVTGTLRATGKPRIYKYSPALKSQGKQP
jgi:hypothetical protein